MTDKEIQSVLDDMTVIIDTREVKYEHITNYLNEHNIKYVREKLDSGDYSVRFPNYPHLELDHCIIIERKNSLTEIAGNFTKGRERFNNEFKRVPVGVKKHLLIEDASFKGIRLEQYMSKMTSKSFLASLLTFSIRYDIKVWFSAKGETPYVIYNLLKYEIMYKLKNI